VPEHRDPLEPGSSTGFRDRIATALVRTGAELATDRQAMIRGISAQPAGTPGRDRALAALAPGGWVEQVLLWVGWRLMARRTLFGPASSPAP
jgi:hypothetical protein